MEQTYTLSIWEIAALETALSDSIDREIINSSSGLTLLRKLHNTVKIILTTRDDD